jgi:hypothetical protein
MPSAHRPTTRIGEQFPSPTNTQGDEALKSVQTATEAPEAGETIKQISELMLDLFHRIDESVDLVKQSCPPEEAAVYQKAAGRVAGPIVMDCPRTLYKTNPLLKAPNWD